MWRSCLVLIVLEADYLWKPPPSCASVFRKKRPGDTTYVTRYRSWPTSRANEGSVCSPREDEKDIVT